jgi:anti-sigma factor RsiW
MTPLTCAATRRKLQAFHDGELPVCDQIDVAAHLEWCDRCATALGEMRLVRGAVRTLAPGREAFAGYDGAVFTAAVVNRAKAEREQSVVARVRHLFDDMHLVYAGLGAAAATVACLVIMLSMMRFATRERPDSLAAIVNFLANPGSNANPAVLDASDRSPIVQLPRTVDASISSESYSPQEDAVFALAAVVTREGTISNLEMLRGSGPRGKAEAQAVEKLMDAMSRARFEPAQVAGLPVAVNMVWLVARTTVRAKHPIA